MRLCIFECRMLDGLLRAFYLRDEWYFQFDCRIERRSVLERPIQRKDYPNMNLNFSQIKKIILKKGGKIPLNWKESNTSGRESKNEVIASSAILLFTTSSRSSNFPSAKKTFEKSSKNWGLGGCVGTTSRTLLFACSTHL